MKKVKGKLSALDIDIPELDEAMLRYDEEKGRRKRKYTDYQRALI